MNQAALLNWFLTSGITECIGETPVNRFLASIKPETSRPIAKQVYETTAAGQSNDTSDCSYKAQAELLASQSATLQDLDKALAQFDGCAIKKTAQHTLTAFGIDQKPLVLCVIDTPKSADEKNGRLCSGEQGDLLLKMLSAIHLDCATDTCICPVIPWRLPGDRLATDTEIELCLPFLKKRIDLIQPKFLLIFGALATRGLTRVDSIPKARQQSLTYALSTGEIPVVATFGPDMVRKSQSYRKNAWEDLKKLANLIETA